jgi:hypothetical protein
MSLDWDALLQSHALEPGDLRDGLYYCDAAARAIMARGDEAEARRLVRVIAVNKQLLSHGLDPLGECTGLPSSLSQSLSEEERALVDKAGLSAAEFEAIRGDGDTHIMGLPVKRSLYRRLVQQCTTKKRRAAEDTEEACQRFIAKKMKALASAELIKLALVSDCRAATGTGCPGASSAAR